MNSLLHLTNVSFVPVACPPVVKDINLEIYPQDFIVLVGSNGSGKSSLIKLINRQYKQTQGEIFFQGQAIENYSFHHLINDIVTLNQFVRDSLFMEMTIEENARLLDMSRRIDKQQKLTASSYRTNLHEYLLPFNQKLANSLKTPLVKLSGGEQQILAIALYLRHRPKLLLLDEHTSALDPKTSQKIMAFTNDMIQKFHITCLMTTHDLNIALHYGNRLIAMQEGQIAYHADSQAKAKLEKTTLLELCY